MNPFGNEFPDWDSYILEVHLIDLSTCQKWGFNSLSNNEDLSFFSIVEPHSIARGTQ